jgi:hypothetical protein
MKNDANAKPDIYAITFNETQYYNFKPGDKELIKSVNQVYVLNRSEYTYLCEITPSYFLEPVYTWVEVVDGLSDEERERLQEAYEHETSEPTYVHVRVVEAIIKDHPERVRHYGNSDDEDDFMTALDDAREYFQGNCPF